MNQKITVSKTGEQLSSYSILIDVNLYDLNAWLPNKKFSQLVIITDHRIKKLYGLRLKKCLHEAGYPVLLISFPAGESYKTYETKQKLEHTMHKNHCDRNTLILALGGGVVGDLAGFIAATYLRGIDYIQIPTSLLAMVDSSIGGKTGINTLHGKNLIGSIYQPKCVVADMSLLKTLPKKHLINGLIEALKMFLTHDEKGFDYLALHLDDIIQGNKQYLSEVMVRAIKIKAGVVKRDEKEQGERSLLNFGHTIGHALEKLTDYRLLHGYAVAYGILVEATISHLLGLLKTEQLNTIKNVLSSLSFHGKDLMQYHLSKLIHATKQDKKSRFGNVHYVLLRAIGNAHISQHHFIHPIDDGMVKQAFKTIIEG